MNHDTFRLIGLDEWGVQENEGNRRLVCQIEGGGKLAIWGSEKSTENIDTVLKADFPCTVHCQWRKPSTWATEYGHTHWVPENASLEVVQHPLYQHR